MTKEPKSRGTGHRSYAVEYEKSRKEHQKAAPTTATCSPNRRTTAPQSGSSGASSADLTAMTSSSLCEDSQTPLWNEKGHSRRVSCFFNGLLSNQVPQDAEPIPVTVR